MGCLLRERAQKLTALAQGGGQLTDGFSGSLGAAQVLTCNYEPFIGHNVNYTATQHSAHNKEALNHNPLNKTLKWAGASRDSNSHMLLFGLNTLCTLYTIISVIVTDRGQTVHM